MLLGIDIGGTKLAAVIGDVNGEILARAEERTPLGQGWRVACDTLVRLARQVCDEKEMRPADAQGIGVSCGGPLDPVAGIVIDPPNLPEWRNVPLRDILASQLENDRICLENDANAAALAEHRWGAGLGFSHLAYLTFGTGMGAGLILGGKLFRGKRDLAGEIGHAAIDPNGPQCLCGKRGCLEAMASGGALDRMARDYFNNPGASAALLCDGARTGDPGSIAIIDNAARALGIGIANLLQTLDLERVILGSLALTAGDLFLEPVRRYAVEYTWPSVMRGVEIVPAGLGSQAQDKAALALAFAGAAADRNQTP